MVQLEYDASARGGSPEHVHDVEKSPSCVKARKWSKEETNKQRQQNQGLTTQVS